jgi:hypothetical protein
LALATDSAALQALIELPAIFVCVSWLVGNRGRGQDGHIAYNQTRRHPYSHISIEELRNSTVRVQENNLDTIMALAQRTFGAAYQFEDETL